MKLIFLDIDGVFNHDHYYMNRPNQFVAPDDIDFNEFDPESVKIFNQIITATNADIVLSSSWRANNDTYFEYLKKLFVDVGLEGKLIAETEIIRIDHPTITIPRGLEIKSYYRKKHNWWYGDYAEDDKSDLESYVIIDDDADMLWEQRNNFVKTDNKIGITNADTELAIKILNTPIEHY